MTYVTRAHTAAETQRAAACLAPLLEAGTVLALAGGLGAGKTTFSQGLCRALDVTDPVTSPTFVLMRSYRGRLPVYHFDVYRLDAIEQLADLDADEYLWGDGICIIEWADRIAPALPPDHLSLELKRSKESEAETRELHAAAHGPRHAAILERWLQRMHDLARGAQP